MGWRFETEWKHPGKKMMGFYDKPEPQKPTTVVTIFSTERRWLFFTRDVSMAAVLWNREDPGANGGDGLIFDDTRESVPSTSPFFYELRMFLRLRIEEWSNTEIYLQNERHFERIKKIDKCPKQKLPKMTVVKKENS